MLELNPSGPVASSWWKNLSADWAALRSFDECC